MKQLPSSKSLPPAQEEGRSTAGVEGELRASSKLERWGITTSTERGRFLIGRVILPLVVTILTLTLGALIAAWLQYKSHTWAERHSGRMATMESLQESALGFSHELVVLKQDVEVWEVTSGNRKLQPLFYPIDRRLELVRGLTDRLASNYDVDIFSISATLQSCKEEIEEYRACLREVLVSRLRPRESAECSIGFEIGKCEQVSGDTFLVWE